MADKKISALTASSTPLAGTEVLPIVQSGATVKVAVSDLTAGRDIAATSITTTARSSFNGGGIYIGNTSSFGTASAAVSIYNGGSSANYIKGDNNYWQLANGTASMQLDASGSLNIGDNSNFGAKTNIIFNPASTNGLLFAVSSGTFTKDYVYFQNSGGSKIGSISSNNSAVVYNVTSDYRIKTNVQPMSGALDKVLQLNPVTYDWIPEFAEGGSQGFIAHELQAIVPECVTGEKDAIETYTDLNGNEQTRPKYQGIDTSFLVATLTAAIKELKAEFDAYKASHP